MEDSDGIEGLYLEKVSVAGRDPEGDAEVPKAGSKAGKSAAALLLGGVPYHHYISAQCSKEHRAIQVCVPCTYMHTNTIIIDTVLLSGKPWIFSSLFPMSCN